MIAVVFFTTEYTEYHGVFYSPSAAGNERTLWNFVYSVVNFNLTLQRYHICIAVVKHFSVYFHGAKANILSVFACAAVRLRVSSHTVFSVINVISFQLFLNAVACLENIGDKFLLLYYNRII